jgi:hypothetical protein
VHSEFYQFSRDLVIDFYMRLRIKVRESSLYHITRAEMSINLLITQKYDQSVVENFASVLHV